MAAQAGLSCAELDEPPPSFRIKTRMHSHTRVYTHTHLEKIRFKRLRSSFPHSEASVEYLLRVTNLPTTDMLFNKWKEGRRHTKPQPTTKVPKRDGETSQLSSVQGVLAKTHPKLISLSLLWSAGRWGNGEGRGKVMGGR